MIKKTMKIGLLGVGGLLTIEDGFLNFKHPYGKTFRVQLKDIETVVVDTVGLGKGKIKIIGRGTDLAVVNMPIKWANKCQSWILSQINTK